MTTTCWHWLFHPNNFLLTLSFFFTNWCYYVSGSEGMGKGGIITEIGEDWNHFQFHHDYKTHLQQAIVYAKCVEDEIPPIFDETSLIMKPAACRTDPRGVNLTCQKCIEAWNNTSIAVPKFHRGSQMPIPLFHCTSHIGDPKIQSHSPDDFKTHFRFEYPTSSFHPSNLSKEEIPRVFVVEKEVDGVWTATMHLPFWFCSVFTKTNSTYRIRITAVSAKHVYYPQLSEPITLYDARALTIGTPENFRVEKTEINLKKARKGPKLILRWESGSGFNASCDWDVYYLDEDVQTKIEKFLPNEAFFEVFDRIQFKKTYTIKIIEKFGFGRESEPMELIVPMEDCLTLVGNNFSLCPPTPPANIRVENETGSSFWIAWDSYDHNFTSQIFYHVTVDKYPNGIDLHEMYKVSPQRLFQTNVPGNQTNLEVPNNSGPGLVKIVIEAKSTGGKSEGRVFIYQLKGDASWLKSLEKFWVLIVILIVLVLTIILIFYLKNFRDRMNRSKAQKDKWLELDKETPVHNTDQYSSKWEVDFGNIVLHDVVGRGQFGEVRKATLYRKGCKTTVAVKTLRVHPDMELEDNKTKAKDIIRKVFREEFEILKGIDPHPNLVGLVAIVKEPMPALVVEFCDGGDLQSHLRKMAPTKMDKKRSSPSPSMMGSMVQLQPNAEDRVMLSMVTNEAYFMKNESLTPLDLLSYASQIACGMEFLSSNKIIHRDLAARNILISGKNRVLKIADFGLSRDVYEQNMYKKKSNGIIPIKWMAPECLFYNLYTTQSDVWSYGVLLWEIVSFGGNPYPSMDNSSIYDELQKGYRMAQPPNTSNELYDLMRQCWEKNPNLRPDFTGIRRRIEELIKSEPAAIYLNLEPTAVV